MFPIFGGSSKRGAMLARTMLDARSSDDLWEKMYQKKLVRNYILDKMEEQELDLILCPVFPFPACKLAEAAELLCKFCKLNFVVFSIILKNCYNNHFRSCCCLHYDLEYRRFSGWSSSIWRRVWKKYLCI